MENLTQSATDLTLNHSDTDQPSMSLGGGGAAVQNLDESNNAMQNMINNQMKQKEQPIEEENNISQGQHEQELYQYNNDLEALENLDATNEGDYEVLANYYKNYSDSYNKDMEKLKNEKNGFKVLKHLRDNNEKYKKEAMAKLRNNINDVKNNKSYDNRSDEQKREDNKQKAKEEREDTAIQRQINDIRKSGLNPAIAYGGGGGAGSSSSGGSSDGEEEKKRKRRQRLEEIKRQETMQKQQLQQKETQMILSAILGTLGTGAVVARPALQAYNVKQGAKNVKDLKSLNWDFMK